MICDSACVFDLIFQDIHRRPQDSAWICVRAWWHWWMYPQIWRIRVRKGFQGSVFQMSFVYYRISHFIKCFMMLFNTTTQLSVTGRLSEFECLRLWKRAVFLKVKVQDISNCFIIAYSIFKMHIIKVKWFAIALLFVYQDIFYGKDVSRTGRLSLNELRNALTNTGNIIDYVNTLICS